MAQFSFDVGMVIARFLKVNLKDGHWVLCNRKKAMGMLANEKSRFGKYQ